MNQQVTILLILPLIGAFISYFVPIKKYAFLGSTLMIGLTTIYAAYLLLTDQLFVFAFSWMPRLVLGWQLDRISLVLILLVLVISLLVHLFSITYMEDDPAKNRYFSFLGFFSFSMVGLLLADHLLLLFVFWELVGFSSYLLIGFWWQNENNAFASRYAFITNRIADTALLSGILWLMFDQKLVLLSTLADHEQVSLGISVLLVVGAFGKSAQGPFFTWLPRAMAGPTPVSALIHAATMVAAGVYLLIRIHPILSESALLIVAFTGAFTALIGSVSALTSYDIKGVLAYSTIAQLGYMVLGVGIGAPDASFFHLWTHAFFKAGLFLSAGAVIHYMHYLGHHELAQDMRAMGGIRHPLKKVFFAYTICMLALAGLPLFTGFLSKEGIILQSIIWAQDRPLGFILPVIALVSAMLTTFYMVRQWLYVFFGQYRGEHLAYQFKEKISLWLPVALLAIGSLSFWYSLNPLGHHFEFIEFVFGKSRQVENVPWLAPVSIVIAMSGAGIGYFRYRGLMDPNKTVEIIKEEFSRSRKGILSLSFHAFYIDWFYTSVLSPLFIRFSQFVYWFDKRWIDGLIHTIGVGTVLFSKAIDLFDKLLVDGLVNFIGWIQVATGNFIRLFHANRLQLHFFWAVLLLVLVIIGFELI